MSVRLTRVAMSKIHWSHKSDRSRVNMTNVNPICFCQAPSLEDYSHLPPEQRRKRLQQKIEELQKELQREIDRSDRLLLIKQSKHCRSQSLMSLTTVTLM